MQHCDHCDLPLFDAPIPGKDGDAQYCCYGCQMLDETVGAEPVDENDATLAPLLRRTIIGGLLAGFTMVLSLAISSEYGFAALRNLEHALGTAHLVLVLTAVPALILLGTPVVQAAWRTLREGRLSLHLLFAMGTSAAVLVSLLSYVRGTGPVYLETAVMLLALYTLGRYLTARSKHRARRVLGALLSVPDTTYERLTPDPGDVPPNALRKDDCIRLHAGDVIPADGVIESGQSFVDTRQLTGESTPVAASEGDRCFAGTQVVDGALELRVTATGADRRLHQIEEAMHNALARPSRLARRTERVMGVLIPGVIALALLAFGGWWWLVGFEKALYVGLSVVLITCPCALGLAVPLTRVLAHGRAATHGVLIRDGQTLLDLHRVSTLVFDKTGTLSRLDAHEVQVEAVALAAVDGTSAPEPDPQQLLQYAAAVETHTHHVLGTAIRDAAASARASSQTLPAAHDVRTVPGAGVVGTVDTSEGARRIGVGSAALVEQMGLSLPPDTAWPAANGRIRLFITYGDVVAGVLFLAETPRDDAAPALDALREHGYTLHLLTGDQPEAAHRLGDTLGLPVTAGQTPEDKLDALNRWRNDGGPVAMVGDGINDAPALAEADVGIAVVQGAPVALQAADITLYRDDLRMLPWLADLSAQTTRIVKQNLWWTFAYNGIGVGLAIAGLLHPIAAVVIMAGSSVLVTANAFRIKRIDPPPR